MHLARVTAGTGRYTVGPVAAAGGASDPLALLLAGESGADGSAFPATLHAALVEGESADGGDTPSEALDVVAGDDDASGSDETGSGLAAALAATLALAGAVVPPPPAAAGAASAAGGSATEGQDAVAAVGVEANADVTTADAPGAAALAASTTTIAAKAAAGDTAIDGKTNGPTTDGAAPGTTQAQADQSAGEAPTGESARPVPQAVAASPVADPASTRVVAGEAAITRPVVGAAHAGTTPITHHGTNHLFDGKNTSDVAGAATATPFSDGGSAPEHGLDLGTPDRRQAFALLERPTSTLTTATVPGPVGEAPPATSAPAGAATGDATSTAPPPAPSGPLHDTASTRVERAVTHPGGIEARWGERVAESLRLSAVRGGGEIRLQLEPEGLGHIDVRLHLQSDGVRAVIVAEHESTRALLASQQHVLQEAFDRSDLRLSGFSVDVGSGGGAANSGRGGEAGQGGSAPPAAPAATTTSADTSESPPAALGNGRVNVRV